MSTKKKKKKHTHTHTHTAMFSSKLVKFFTFWSNSDLSTARWSTWWLNSWTSVRGLRTFSGTGIGSLHEKKKTMKNKIDSSSSSTYMYACKVLLRIAAYSFNTGCALKILIWASCSSILLLSSISLCNSSSCLTRLSNWKGSGFVHCLGSGFGGTCIICE